jgi:hypothetical protein
MRKLGPIKGSDGSVKMAYAFLKECCICGAPNAEYGEGSSIIHGRGGTWYCRAHWRERQRETLQGGAGS